jgi:hypothetical protein
MATLFFNDMVVSLILRLCVLANVLQSLPGHGAATVRLPSPDAVRSPRAEGCQSGLDASIGGRASVWFQGAWPIHDGLPRAFRRTSVGHTAPGIGPGYSPSGTASPAGRE